MTMFAVRREDSARWPAPWRIPTGGTSSSRVPWDYAEAVAFVDANRNERVPWAIYHGNRKVYPTEVPKAPSEHEASS